MLMLLSNMCGSETNISSNTFHHISDCDWQSVRTARQSAESPELFDQWSVFTMMCAAGIILCMRPASDRRCYSLTPSLAGWAYT